MRRRLTDIGKNPQPPHLDALTKIDACNDFEHQFLSLNCITATAALLSLLAVAYFVIPPRNSFAFATLWDAVCFGVFLLVAVIVMTITGTQSDMSTVCAKRRTVSAIRLASSGSASNAEGEIMQYLRAEAHHLTQIARACADVQTAHELEGISVKLMAKAAEMEKVFNVRPNSSS